MSEIACASSSGPNSLSFVMPSKPLRGASTGFGSLITRHRSGQLGLCDGAPFVTSQFRQKVPHVSSHLVRPNPNPVCIHLSYIPSDLGNLRLSQLLRKLSD